MTKRKSNRDKRHGLKALRHGPAHSLGAMLNTRHPKKCPSVMKKTALDATNIQDGKQTPESD